MQQYNPVYNHRIAKNKSATASLVLSIISIGFLVLIIPLFFVGGLLVSMAGQHPQSSGVDIDNPEAMEEYARGSRNLGNMGLTIVASPIIISGVTGILGIVFGIFGVMKPNKREQAIAGIVISCIPIWIGNVVFYFEML